MTSTQRKLVIFVFICMLLKIATSQRRISYEGYSLIRITPKTQLHLQYLLNLTALTSGGIEFWLQTSAVDHPADVMISPSEADRVSKNLNSLGMPFAMLIPDIGKVIEGDLVSEFFTPYGFEFYSDFQSIEEIGKHIRALAYLYPNHVSLLDIGASFEGRPLEILRVSRGAASLKPAIWIQGGVHAREQIGPAVVLFIAEQLISSYYNNYEAYDLVNSFDWYFLPVLNPDGYNYCQLKDRLWRKTRSRHPSNKRCIGVDANRNWNIRWNNTGSSPKPCSHTYAGTLHFSEPETNAVSGFMTKNLRGRFELFVDFHSYSQRWLTPWGFSSELPPTYEKQKRLAEIATSALRAVNGTQYSVGSSGNIMYTVSGGARDWVHDVLKASYSYVVELRDKGNFGFLLPRKQILPTAIETWEGIKAMCLDLLRNQDIEPPCTETD